MTARIEEFRAAIRAAGMEPPEAISSGKIHRFPGVGKTNGNKAGWCRLFDDGEGGVFGDFAANRMQIWHAKRDKPLSTAERQARQRAVEQAKAEAEAARMQRHAEAVTKAARIWNAAQPAPSDHAYLTRKGIQPHGARLHKDALVIPVRIGATLHSLQFISPDGKKKRFLKNGRIEGCYCDIGRAAGTTAICVCEGFATGATIHEATGMPVVVAFNAGNLEPVARLMRERYPDRVIVLCADDDEATDGNPGLTKATEAADAVGGVLAVPDFGNHRPERATDFNDMARACGAERVKETIERALSNFRSLRKLDQTAIFDPAENTLIDVNQDSVAIIFAKRFAGELRYSHDRGRWYRWDGARWVEETTRLAFEYTRRLTRAANHEGKSAIAKASFCEGVEKFAQADRVFAMSGREWDPDAWLLNTPDGTVDLRTGEIRPARQLDLITKITAVAPRRVRQSRLWDEFLRQITQGDDEMIAFLRRMAGYALTGDTREECLFFVYGPGGNGKGTFVGALFNILAEYAVNATMDVFLASRNDRHSTDLAMLRGARLVTASETTEGRAWDEQRLKAMTGNDPITARFMRQDNFTYLPQFKLILIGNNKPILRTVDDAWRRRFHVIPFTFTPATKDITLKDRLRDEYPEILRWAIEGCIEWQECGLRPPQRVQEETQAYFEAQDIFASWIEDCCEIAPAATALTSELFRSWSVYCERHHEHPGTNRTFSDRLASRGYRRVRNQHGLSGRGFIGIKVVPFSHLEPPA